MLICELIIIGKLEFRGEERKRGEWMGLQED